MQALCSRLRGAEYSWFSSITESGHTKFFGTTANAWVRNPVDLNESGAATYMRDTYHIQYLLQVRVLHYRTDA